MTPHAPVPESPAARPRRRGPGALGCGAGLGLSLLLLSPALPTPAVEPSAPPKAPANRDGPPLRRASFTLRVCTGYHTVAFSPDGKRLASIVPGNKVQTWDAATGKEAATFAGHANEVIDVAFSPDGKWLASAGRDGTRLWDAATGRNVFTTDGQNWTNRVAFSPDGRRLASAGNGGVKLWDVPTGREIRTFPDASVWVSTVTFSPDGKRLAFGNNVKVVRVWDVATGKEVRTLTGHADAVYTAAYSPCGKLLASASGDRTVKVWDAATGREVFALRGHAGPVYTVAFSPNGQLLATAGGDRLIKLWSAASGRELLTLRGHTGQAYCAAFSPDGVRLATTGTDGTVQVWNLGLPRRAAAPSPAELNRLWADLKGADAPRAFRAGFTLSASPRQALPFLKERLRPARASSADAARLDKLVADLDDNRYRVRRQAVRELERLGRLAEARLRLALQENLSAEARRSVEGLLLKVQGRDPSPEQLFAERATDVLERIGTPEARGLLEALARGAPGSWLTFEAKAALARLDQRAVALGPKPPH